MAAELIDRIWPMGEILAYPIAQQWSGDITENLALWTGSDFKGFAIWTTQCYSKIGLSRHIKKGVTNESI